MIKINPAEPKTLKFKLDVSGAESAPRARLVLDMRENQGMIFDGEMEEGRVTIKIPPLTNYYRNFTGEAKLEVLVDQYIFLPWSDKFEFKMEPKVESVIESIVTPKEPFTIVAKIEEDEGVKIKEDNTSDTSDTVSRLFLKKFKNLKG